MLHHYSVPAAKLIRRIQKLHKRLQIALSGTKFSISQKQMLQKQYERCLQKLTACKQPLLRAGCVLGAAALLSTSASAQSQTCDSFRSANRSNPIARIQATFPGAGNPNFIDIDGDGDFDCYETSEKFVNGVNTNSIFFMRNIGTKANPSYQLDTASGFSQNFSYAVNGFTGTFDGPRFVDMDGDGDYDCILPVGVGTDDGKLRYFENTGTASKVILTERTGAANPFSFVTANHTYGIRFALADIDNDGDYDLVVSLSYNQSFYVNVGTKKKASFKLYSTEHDPTASAYAFYDWSGDGLLDEFTDNLQYYKNTGQAKKPVFTLSSDGPVIQPGANILIQFLDFNNDGFIDIFDYSGNFLTTSPDAYILYDSTKSNTLRGYPRVAGSTFRWLRNGVVIAGATGNSYTPTQPGNYVVQVKAKCGTNASLPTTVYTIMPFVKAEAEDMTVQSSVGSLPGASVKAYPNPFTHTFVVQLNSNINLSKTTIRITDVQGKVVETIKPNSTAVHMGANLSKGVFVVQVMNDNGVTYQQKVMKY